MFVTMRQTYHRIVHDVALDRPLGHVQGPSHNVHIVTAPGKCLHKTLKPCPVVSALQRTNSIRTEVQCRSWHAVSVRNTAVAATAAVMYAALLTHRSI